MTQATTLKRLHHMDNLRALAMLLGVVFHASLAYSPMLHFFWLPADNQAAEAIDVFAWFSHLFRMPLFFLIAGFFAIFLIEKRGLKGFLINRTMRVLLPLVLFLPLVLWAIVAGIQWAGEHVNQPSPALYYATHMMTAEMADAQPINTGHLWFLYYLCFFYVLISFLWLLRFFQWKIWHKLMQPWVWIGVLPWLLVPAFYLLPAPHPAPETLQPLLWPFLFYGVFFLMGALLFKHQQLIQQLQPWLYGLLLAGLGSHIYFVTQVPEAEGNWLMAASESLTAWYLTLACLLAGQRWLDQHQKITRYIADASYWIYLVHIPVLFVVQYVFLDINWNLWVEFLLTTLITFGLGLFSYALLVRHTPIGWLLNGKRAPIKQSH